VRRVKEKLVVEGFLISYYLPTEDLLCFTIDLTDVPKGKYMDLVIGLQDILSGIDERHTAAAYGGKHRTPRGRSLRARYTRVLGYDGKPIRKRVLRLSPYPSSFSNFFKRLRRTWYEELNSNTVILTKSGEYGLGYATRRNLYLLPYERAPDLMLVKRKLNENIEGLKRSAKDYEGTKDWEAVFKYISKTLGRPITPEPAKVHAMLLDLHQITLEPRIFERYLEEKGKEYLAEMDEEKRKGLKEIYEELDRTRHDIIERAIMDLQSRMADLMRKLSVAASTEISVRRAKGLRSTIEGVHSLAKSVGVEHFIEQVTATSLKLIDAMETKKKSAIRDAADAIAVEAGIDPLKDPAETLKESAIALTKGLSPRVKALLTELM